MKRVLVALLCMLGLNIASAAAEPVPLFEQEQVALRAATERIAPLVVRLEMIGGLQQATGEQASVAIASGVIVTADGYVLASRYALTEKVDSLVATLADGSQVGAQLIAADHARGITLLKLQGARTWTPAEVVAPSDLRVGAWTVAVARSVEIAQPNVSVGILSAKDRLSGRAVQTDCKVSASNYGGALVDVQGRLIGVLIEPPAEAAAEGNDLYDSGIGFAVPVAEMLALLPRLQSGHDLHPGLMGIHFQSNDANTQPPLVSAIRIGSPARTAGIKKGDLIVAIDGKRADRQARMRQLLGVHYAGDHVQVTLSRDRQERQVELELIEKLPPFERPMLGILPQPAADDEKGVMVREALPESAASEAGLRGGDVITKIGDTTLDDAAALRTLLADHEVGDELKVQFKRGDEKKSETVKLTHWQTELMPQSAPRRPIAAKEETQPTHGIVPLKLAEFPNTCHLFVPDSYQGQTPYALLVWLPPPGKVQVQKEVERWRNHCREAGFILLVVQSKEADRWQRDEVAVISQAIQQTTQNWNIDEARVIVGGKQAGGTMSWLSALHPRSTVTGVIAIESPLPGHVKLPEADPNRPLSVYLAHTQSRLALARIQSSVSELQKQFYPLLHRSVEGEGADRSIEDPAEIARWIDTLDRM